MNTLAAEEDEDDDDDAVDPELLARALEICRRENQISTSILQRNLRLGYTIASRLAERIRELGLGGPDHS
jgi:DNA segregation ATPase FtsK/SpoIIIE-like protein